MISSVKILCLCAFIVSSQGFQSSDEGLRFLEALNEELEDHLSGVQLLIKDGLQKLPELHDLELSKALARNQRSTSEVLDLAKGCTKDVRNELANIGYSFGDRWGECVNLTQILVDYERVGFNAYTYVLSWKPQICQGVNDVMLCFDQSSFRQPVCVYDVVTKFLDKFTDVKKQVLDIIDQLNKLYLQTAENFKGCFFNNESNVRREQMKLLEKYCQ